MDRRRPSPRGAEADDALSPLVALLVLVLATGLVAAGVHAWVSEFRGSADAGPQADVVFRQCTTSDDIVTVSLESGGPLGFEDIRITLRNDSRSAAETTLNPPPIQGSWEDGDVLTLGRTEGRLAVPWGNPDGLRSPGGLDANSLYILQLDHRNTDVRVETVGFTCR